MGISSFLLLGQMASVTVSGRVETTAQLTSQQQYADASAGAGVVATWADRVARLEVGYGPTFSLSGLGTGQAQDALLHTGHAALGWQGRRSRLELREEGTYGRHSYWTADESAGGAVVEPASGELEPMRLGLLRRSILRGSSQTTLSWGHSLSRRWSTGAAVGYYYGGGMNGESRGLYPLIRGPNGRAQLTHRVTRIDDVSWHVEGVAYRADRDMAMLPDAYLEIEDDPWSRRKIHTASSAIDWTHRFSRRLVGAVGAGAAARGRHEVLPAAMATVTLDFSQSGALWHWVSEAALAPEVAPLMGVVEERVRFSSRLNGETSPWVWTLGASGSSSVSGAPDAGTTAVGLSAAGGWAFARNWLAELGLGWTRYRAGDVWAPSRTAPFVALGYSETFGGGH